MVNHNNWSALFWSFH